MSHIEAKIKQIITERRAEIIAFAEDIFDHPEVGFKETRTAEVIARNLERLGLPVRRNLALTGVKGYLKSDQSANAISVALVADLDAVKAPFHPKADPVTKAAHACGHHAQMATLFGAALALSDPEVAAALDGNVIFFGVPAEEYGEIEFKSSLKEQGRIGLLGGKPELLRLGEFDEIDIALGHHVEFGGKSDVVVASGSSMNGFIAKVVRYIGKAAHAAGAPHEGINALNAAVIGLNALNAQRETFKESDTVRIHPILTKGGDLVNVIPSEVTVEMLVRAKTIEAILDANAKATRAFEAGAHAVGARIEISDQPGYLPRILEADHAVITDVARELVDPARIRVSDRSEHLTASNDFGDVNHILPVLTFSTGGVSGVGHGADFKVEDPEIAYILPAKIAALTIYRLLKEKAAEARKIKAGFKPKLTKEGYLEYINGFVKAAR